MLTRKNPARAGNKPSATQPQPANNPDHPTQHLASGDAGTPSPTARRAPKSSMITMSNGAVQSKRTQPADPGIYDANGVPIPDADSPEMSRAGGGEERLFRELLTPRKDPPLPSTFYYTDDVHSKNRDDMMRDSMIPAPTTARSSLYDIGVSYITGPTSEDQTYYMDEDLTHPPDIPSDRVPPLYDYQLTPPTNLLYLVSQFNPRELAPGDINPSGSPHIVQSAEHAYALMAMEAEGRLQAAQHHMQAQNHMPPRSGGAGGGVAPGGSVVYGEGVAYALYPDPRVHGQPHMLRQQHQVPQGSSPISWQQHQQHQHQQPQQRRPGGAPSGTWSAQQSPTSVPRGWQPQQQQPQAQAPQTSPRNQGQDHHHHPQPHHPSSAAFQQQHSPPPGTYRTQPAATTDWPQPGTQVQEPSQLHIGDRATPPSSSSPAFWRPGQGGPSPQSAPTAAAATTTTHVRQRDGSLSSWPPQGSDPTRPPSSSMGAPPPPPASRHGGPGPSPVTTANPVGSWGPGHPMVGGPPPNTSGAGWPGHPSQQVPAGMQPRQSAGSLHQQQPHPHPEIDGPADGMRWSTPSNTTEPSIPHGWQAPPPPEGSNNGSSNAAGGDTGRPTMQQQQVRMYGNTADRMGSNQTLSSAPARQGVVRPPWMTAQQMNNPPGGVPLDGRIQTPGGTGAMGGGHAAAAASEARPPTAGNPAPMAGGTYAPTSNNAPSGYASYATRSGAIHGGQPTRPGEYGSAPGNEIPYSSQPDSMAAYRASSGPAGGMQPPPPSAVAPGGGAPQGYTMAGGPMPSGNSYPPVPPASGATPYGISRSGMISQQQQQLQHQQQQQQHHQQPPVNPRGNMYPNLYAVSQQPPLQQSQSQGPNMNGSIYAPYSSGGAHPPVTYPMNAGGPMSGTMTRPPPGQGGPQMNQYAAMGGPHPLVAQEMYSRMQGLPGVGGVDGYRPQQQQPPH